MNTEEIAPFFFSVKPTGANEGKKGMKYMSKLIGTLICLALVGCMSLDERLASSDYNTRKKAEIELYSTATKTGNEEATIATINRISCDEVLASISISGKSIAIRSAAATKIKGNKYLYEVAIKSTDKKAKAIAINNMTDQAMLFNAYNKLTENDLKIAALGRMNSDTIAKLPYSSSLATKWRDINDQRILKEIIEKDLLKIPDAEWQELIAKVTDEYLKADVEWSLASTYSGHYDSLSDEAKNILLANIADMDVIAEMIAIERWRSEEEFIKERKKVFENHAYIKKELARLREEEAHLEQKKKKEKDAYKANRISEKIAGISNAIQDFLKDEMQYNNLMKKMVCVPNVEARIPLYSKLPDEILSKVLDKKFERLGSFNGGNIERWNECATIVANIETQDIRTQKYIDLLVKIAGEEDRDKKQNSWRQTWNDETRVKASQYFDSWSLEKQPAIVEKIMTQGVVGSKYVANYATPEMLLRLFREGKLNKNLQLLAAKKVDASSIDMALYDSIKNDDVRKILLDRMPDSVKAEAQKSNEQVVASIIETANAKKDETFSLKGFYLGMPIEDAKHLLTYYLPNSKIVISKASSGESAIEIDVNHKPDFDVTPMYFCRADRSGAVYLFNFDKERFLSKWFDYDVQTYREWAIAYGLGNNCDFRVNRVKGRNDKGSVWIRVSQEVFQYKNNKNNYLVSVFGEKNVYDPNTDPTDAELMSGMLGNTDAMYKFGLIEGVRAWVRNGWENGDGAREGTLRIQRSNN